MNNIIKQPFRDQNTMTAFVFDVETTGRKAPFADIIQLAISDLNSDYKINVRVKPNPFHLVSPASLVANGMNYSRLWEAENTQYDLGYLLEDVLKTPKIAWAWNAKFDKKFIRNTLYKTGRYPYKDVRNGGIVGDAMSLTSLASMISNKIEIPLINNKRSHKLVDVFAANVNGNFNPHDAMEDTNATKLIMRALSVVPELSNLWSIKEKLFSKPQRTRYFSANTGFYTYSWRTQKFKHHLCIWKNGEKYITINTATLPEELQKVKKDLGHSKRPDWLTITYPNMDDIIFGVFDFPELKLGETRYFSSEYLKEVCEMILQSEFTPKEFPKQKYLEQREFNFPEYSDEVNWAKFHSIKQWEKKQSISFNEKRSIRICERLFYAERPDLLEADFVEMRRKDFRGRWLSEKEEEWVTVKSALSEIMSIDVTTRKTLGLDIYERYLTELRLR